jgi:ribosomal protein L15
LVWVERRGRWRRKGRRGGRGVAGVEVRVGSKQDKHAIIDSVK